jgi:hypothetical protein
MTHVACEIYFKSNLGPTIFWMVVLVNQGVPVASPLQNDKEIKHLDMQAK